MSSSHWILIALGLFQCSHGMITTVTGPITSPPPHPPVPTVSITPLPDQFSGIGKKNLECWQSLAEYHVIGNWLAQEYAKSITYSVTTLAPPITSTKTNSYQQKSCTTTALGLTTLCDGYPRGTGKDVKCITTPYTYTYEETKYFTSSTYIYPTWTSEFRKPSPTCSRAAENGSKECDLAFQAYSYLVSKIQSETPRPTGYSASSWYAYSLYLMNPFCVRATSTTSSAYTPFCRMTASEYAVHYWPTPTPTGSDFCSKILPPTPTPTPTGKPKTAVVSGLTLTSPSVYHFLKGLKVETMDYYNKTPARYPWYTSSVVPNDQIVTVAQLEKDILTASATCSGIEADYCSVHIKNDFSIQDVFTARASAYSSNCRYCLGDDHGTIYQGNFKPTMAVAYEEVARQLGKMEECMWETYGVSTSGWLSTASSTIGAIQFNGVDRTAFVAITATEAVG